MPHDLPDNVIRVLDLFVEEARRALGADLRSVVLFGSGAEGKLRPTSDVNLILVLRSFDPSKVDRLRDAFRTAHAAIRLEAMFLLEAEIPAALEAFAAKFADVVRRHRVLLGDDPFAGVVLSRAAEIARLRQALLNLALRLRQRYVLLSLREEQAERAVADAAGPLRGSAATLLELEGTPAPSAKEALVQAAGSRWQEALAHLSRAHAGEHLAPGAAGATLLALAELAAVLAARAAELRA